MLRVATHSLKNGYPTSSKWPMPETDWHRILMCALIDTLWDHFLSESKVYVSGNLLIFYEPGNKRKHVSPDVFFVRGVEKKRRPNYLVWEEGRGPQVAIELTSATTQKNDQTTKYKLYQDVLKVREYFLFDPDGDYLDPRLKGYRLWRGEYREITAVNGRLPSVGLGLHLERDGNNLRLWDPTSGEWLRTPAERVEQEVEAREQEAEAREQAEARAELAERENDRLRAALKKLQGEQGS